MTTATPSPTLERMLVERAQRYLDGPSGEAEDVKSTLFNLKNVLIGDWHKWETDNSEERVGEEWVSALDAHLIAEAWETIELEVIPAMARAAVAYVRDNPPPPHLVAFAGSEQLRADLAALEGEGR